MGIADDIAMAVKATPPYGGIDERVAFKVARNELGHLRFHGSDALANASRAVALCYLDRYSTYPEIVKAVTEVAFKQLAELELGGSSLPARLSPNFVLGRALAAAARDHAEADLDLVRDDFDERATMCLEDVIRADLRITLPHDKSPLGPARMAGVDMGRKIRSTQGITPKQVKDILRERLDDEDDRKMLKSLTYEDFEALARELMESYGGIEFDCEDASDLADRARELVEEREASDVTEAIDQDAPEAFTHEGIEK